MQAKSKIKVFHIATADIALKFLLLNHLLFLKNKDYDVSAICSPGPWVFDIEQSGIKVKQISMTRRITPLQDFMSFVRLVKYLREQKPDIVHTHTPKAGFLGTLAARLVRIPIIIHTNHGFYFHENSSWLHKQIFMCIERIIAWNVHLVFSVNKEDMVVAGEKHIAGPNKMKYFGGWVNVDKYNTNRFSEEFLINKKKELGIPNGVPVIGIVARLVREKGYFELFEAMKTVIAKFPNALLVSVGFTEPEKKDGFLPEIAQKYGIWDNILFLGKRTDVDEILPLMNIFTLPSWREGIGTSILEASAMKLPVVSTNVRGCREAVDDGITGKLVPHKNRKKLAEALIWMLEHPKEAKLMGQAGRKKMEIEFDECLVFGRLEREYNRLVQTKLKM
ncbi:MAG: Glycosyl transferase group 1 [Candidatus Daviesbacteria bacterium GW2011_GWA2_38_24]|uniref:Glycosyl transferase group 1 n=1 Tax=Candidatus Daviesbacteria bacterium GW2011_GWA2_38_24 TaxID=1618422 RepID=A0A0G0LY99_9BACT|nr:MAG: Glycosyl transferase group 1 [Candidatus Daviesbacteria bacterium GW2011_GWA2_38_24]